LLKGSINTMSNQKASPDGRTAPRKGAYCRPMTTSARAAYRPETAPGGAKTSGNDAWLAGGRTR
jgi:hypothetical protein